MFNQNEKIGGVEDLLRSQLKGGRPLTPAEIETKLKDVKSKHCIYKEINQLQKFNTIKRIQIEIGSSYVVMYSMQSITKKDIKIKVR